jgi:hypothetical protein
MVAIPTELSQFLIERELIVRVWAPSARAVRFLKIQLMQLYGRNSFKIVRAVFERISLLFRETQLKGVYFWR